MNKTFQLMTEIGGNFARQLALAWFAADPGNRAKIEVAFAELVSHYAAMVAAQQK